MQLSVYTILPWLSRELHYGSRSIVLSTRTPSNKMAALLCLAFQPGPQVLDYLSLTTQTLMLHPRESPEDVSLRARLAHLESLIGTEAIDLDKFSHSNTTLSAVLDAVTLKLNSWINTATVESRLLMELLMNHQESALLAKQQQDEGDNPYEIVVIERLEVMARSLIQLETLYRDSLRLDTTESLALDTDIISQINQLFTNCNVCIKRTIVLAYRLKLRHRKHQQYVKYLEDRLMIRDDQR